MRKPIAFVVPAYWTADEVKAHLASAQAEVKYLVECQKQNAAGGRANRKTGSARWGNASIRREIASGLALNRAKVIACNAWLSLDQPHD